MARGTIFFAHCNLQCIFCQNYTISQLGEGSPVDNLQIDEQGVARRGLLIRHLVLPNGLAGTEGVVRFLAQEVSPNTYLNIMAQYHPCYKASDMPQLARPVSTQEFHAAITLAHRQGLSRLDSPDIPLPLKLILR